MDEDGGQGAVLGGQRGARLGDPGGGGEPRPHGPARLLLSPLTAKTHVSRIMAELGARDRSQVVVMAYEYRMVTSGRLQD